MAEEFEGDLAGAVFWGADLHGARFRDVDLTGVRIDHAWVIGVEIDSLVDRLVVNGVDVTDYVNERDEWFPLRKFVLVTQADEMRAGAVALGDAWAAAIETARQLPESLLHESVDGEFSFAQTLRHLVFAIDKWFAVPILGGSFHAWGLPNTGSRGFGWPGLDLELDPPFEEVVAAYVSAMADLRGYVATLTDDELHRSVDILENGPNEIHQCIGVVFEESFWHLRYARRDLDALTG